jgi:hypothetical protein
VLGISSRIPSCLFCNFCLISFKKWHILLLLLFTLNLQRVCVLNVYNLNKVSKIVRRRVLSIPDPDMYLSSRAIVVYIYIYICSWNADKIVMCETVHFDRTAQHILVSDSMIYKKNWVMLSPLVIVISSAFLIDEKCFCFWPSFAYWWQKISQTDTQKAFLGGKKWCKVITLWGKKFEDHHI